MMMSGGAFSGRSSSGQVDGDTFGRVYDKRVIFRLLPYVRPYRKFAILASIAMLVYVGSQLAIPFLLKHGIDEYIEKDNFRGLLALGGIFIVIALGGMAANYFQQLFMARVGLGMLYDLRRGDVRTPAEVVAFVLRQDGSRAHYVAGAGRCLAASGAHDRDHYDRGGPP